MTSFQIVIGMLQNIRSGPVLFCFLFFSNTSKAVDFSAPFQLRLSEYLDADHYATTMSI